MNEIWKDIVGYEGWYQVSNFGEVRSVQRSIKQLSRYGVQIDRIMPGKTIKPTDNGNGYKIVGLRMNGKRRNHYVHRLVAEAFLDRKNIDDVINHKDRNTSNNSVDNLEWVRQKENVLLAVPFMKHRHNMIKKSASGEKHIYIRNGRYRVAIKGICDKTFASIEDAICLREVVLNGEEHTSA